MSFKTTKHWGWWKDFSISRLEGSILISNVKNIKNTKGRGWGKGWSVGRVEGSGEGLGCSQDSGEYST